MQKTARLIGRVILSHHGLHDWVNDDAEDTFRKRTEKEKYYAEILQNADFIPDIGTALSEAVAEVRPLRQKLREMAGNNQEIFAFYLGMLERLLQSVLIDADRTNTADFMSGTKTESQSKAPIQRNSDDSQFTAHEIAHGLFDRI